MSQYPILMVPSKIKSAYSVIPVAVPVFVGLPPKEPDKPQEIEWKAILSLPQFCIAFIVLLIPGGIVILMPWFLFLVWQQIKGYKERLRHWESKKKDFEYMQYEYQQRKSKVLTQQEIDNYRKQQIRQALTQTLPPDGTESKARKGWNENPFKLHLNKYFPNKIHQGLTLKNPDYSIPYSPDFTYIDKSLNLYIDIELDEAYVFHTHEPTHFKESKKDKKRNDFFLDRNWIVIRFAEEQVYKHPEECCKFVATVALKCGIPMPEALKKVATLPSIPRWTDAEAREMAVNKTRDSYR
jgi:hypothetical protein